MPFPVIALDSIPTHGLAVQVLDWARVGCGEGLGGECTSVSGHLEVSRKGRHIVVNGQLAGAATVICDRCGEPCHFSAAGAASCVYLPFDEIAATKVDEDSQEEALDHGEYDGVALDLVHVVREFFALERPARVLCADFDPAADAACLERFRSRADLSRDQPDPRFALLKGVKPTR
ncbi:MAG: DUF177 domain-containing protein [Pseudomonadota bacterium]|nr:DUF177 domain-containing protein [Pseudomonadota bacterium]